MQTGTERLGWLFREVQLGEVHAAARAPEGEDAVFKINIVGILGFLVGVFPHLEAETIGVGGGGFGDVIIAEDFLHLRRGHAEIEPVKLLRHGTGAAEADAQNQGQKAGEDEMDWGELILRWSHWRGILPADGGSVNGFAIYAVLNGGHERCE